MTPKQLKSLKKELQEYVEYLTTEMGRPERRNAMGDYVHGLLLDGERKSIVPMANRMAVDESDREGLRQRLQRCVKSSWKDEELYRRIGTKLNDELPECEAFVVDDTGFAKKGEHSVGVARQYSGTLGRTDNCQIAVSLHLAGNKGSGCIGFRLYLPEVWTTNRMRCQSVGVPEDVLYEPKWKIALGLIDQALSWGIAKKIIVADAGYGDATGFREGIEKRELYYAVGVSGVSTIWRPGIIPCVPNPPNVGRHSTHAKGSESPISLSNFARELPKQTFRAISWRNGSKGKMSGRFCAFGVYSAERHTKKIRPALHPIWIVIEDTAEEKRPFKFYFSNLPEKTSLKRLIKLIKLRWRVERDYQDMKQEVGLDSYEGRTWLGFHHHAALCSAAHAFLAIRRALFSPEQNIMDVVDGAQVPSATPYRKASSVSLVPPQIKPTSATTRTITFINEQL
jgi:SRSO17 transposase